MDTAMQDINRVYEKCKFGRFHIRLLTAAFLGILTSTQITNSASYLLPIAECDLDMSLRQKGLLNAMPYIGMICSSVISGYLIDSFGRILFMKIAYSGIFIFQLLSGLSQNFEMIASAKFGEGLLSAVALNGMSSLISEFCHPSVRDRVLLFQSSFTAIAYVASPLIAWAILIHNLEVKLFGGAFVLRIWNFYLLTGLVWSISSYILFATIPESPKFLVIQKKYREARSILIRVYAENTGKRSETFPFPNLWSQEIKDEPRSKNVERNDLNSYGHKLIVGLQNIKPLFHRPLICYLAIIGAMQAIDLGTYNVFRLWFPQLYAIVEHYKLDGQQNLCSLLDTYTADENMRLTNITRGTSDVCVPHISGSETYINSIIIGLVCIIPYFIGGVVVNKVGKKWLLVAFGLITVGGLLGIRWANSKTVMVTLIAINVAIMQAAKGLTQMVIVEVFPTSMRSFASAIVMSIARVGVLVSNITFPVLLDLGCELAFYVMAALMICFIVLGIFTPKKEAR